jgi:hypothetical protein
MGRSSKSDTQGLIRESFFKQPNKRTIEDVTEALERKGLPTQGKESKIMDILTRRMKKGILKKTKSSDGHIHWTE